MRSLTLLLLLFVAVPTLRGQSPPSLGPEGRVGGVLGGGAGVTTVKGTLVPAMRGQAALQLLPWLRLGAEAAVPFGGIRLSPEASPSRSELRLGYGGVRLDLGRWAARSPGPWRVSLLAGAGTARVRVPAVGADLGSENFLFLEPALHRSLAERGAVTVSGSLGFRFVSGGGGLPGVGPRDLHGASLGFTVDFARSP